MHSINQLRISSIRNWKEVRARVEFVLRSSNIQNILIEIDS